MFSTGGGGAGHHTGQTVSPMNFTGETECQLGECPCVRSRKSYASALNSSWGSERSPELVRLARVRSITISRKRRRPGSAGHWRKVGTKNALKQRFSVIANPSNGGSGPFLTFLHSTSSSSNIVI